MPRESLRTKCERLQQELDRAARTIAEFEQRELIDSSLREADAINLAASRLLSDRMIAVMDEDDLHIVIMELQQANPNLFRKSKSPRRDLIRYLRRPKT